MLLIFLSKFVFVILYLNHGHQEFYYLVFSPILAARYIPFQFDDGEKWTIWISAHLSFQFYHTYHCLILVFLLF